MGSEGTGEAGHGLLAAIDPQYLERVTVDLCRVPSPTGLADRAVELVERELQALEIPFVRTTKGALVATLQGRQGAAAGERTLAAHVDTLGAMVAYIKGSGRLQLTQIGGYAWNAIEGEYCTIHTVDGRTYTGTIMVSAASSHVHGDRTGKSER